VLRLVPLIAGGVVATTASLDAEALYRARRATEYEQLWNDRRTAYEYLPTHDEHWHTALGAQRELARTGRHRSVGVHGLQPFLPQHITSQWCTTTPTSKPPQRSWHSNIAGSCHAAPSSGSFRAV
jgi:hypothetical protein